MRKPAGSLMRARFFLIASALAPPCGTCGISMAVPVVLNSDSLSRLPAVGCCASAACAARMANDPANANVLMVSSRVPQPHGDCHAGGPERNRGTGAAQEYERGGRPRVGRQLPRLPRTMSAAASKVTRGVTIVSVPRACNVPDHG